MHTWLALGRSGARALGEDTRQFGAQKAPPLTHGNPASIEANDAEPILANIDAHRGNRRG
jgi:hypothetical protein